MDASNFKKGKQSSELEQIRPDAAGVDLGSKEHVVAVGEHLVKEGESRIRYFATHTKGIHELVEWLVSLGVGTVAMEATGVYWMGLYEALEQANLDVCLVNARHLKNVAGRKTDVIDAKWIQVLHSYGLLRPSHVPEQIIRDLRSYVRQRENLKQEKSRAIMHIHKALDMMNVKVHHHISNMDGPTGMKILREMVGGQTDSKALSQFHTRQLKVTKEELEISLQGNYRPAHLFALKQALDRFDFAAQQMQDCDLAIERLLAQLTEGLDTLPEKGRAIRPLRRKQKKMSMLST